jgi:two-component system NarL family sensor kinase
MKNLLRVCFLSCIVLCSCKNEPKPERDDQLLPEMGEVQLRIENINKGKLIDSSYINKSLRVADTLMRRNTDSAKFVLTYTLYNSRNIGYEQGIVRSYLRFGKICFDENKFDTALIFFQKGLYHAKKTPKELSLNATVNNVIGATYHRLGKTDSSAFYLYQAAALLDGKDLQTQIKDKDDQIYLNIGLFWLHQADAAKSNQFLKKAWQIASSRKDSLQLLNIQYNFAHNYQNEKKFDSATALYTKVLQSPLTDTATSIGANINSGNIYLWTGQPGKSISFYRKAYQLSQAINNEQEKVKSAHKLAQAYFLLKDYEAAAPIFLETVKQSEKLGLPDELDVAYQYLAALSDERRQYQKASEYRALLIALWLGRHPKEKAEMMNRLDVQYKVAEKEKQILQKQLLLDHQQNQLREQKYWIGSAVAGSLFFLALAGNMYRSNRRRTKLHDKQLQVLQQQRQIEQMQAVMRGEEQERTRLARELHDGVGGMLAAIKMNISAVQDHQRIIAPNLEAVMQMVESTAQEVRKAAHNLMPDILQQYNLQEALRMYCNSINDGNGLQIDLQFHTPWQQLKPSVELALYRILQELIQNIVKHANATQASIQFREDDTLHVTVEDDGVGFNINEVQKGLGLENIRSRVAALQGDLTIESTPGRGTTCYIELNTEKNAGP